MPHTTVTKEIHTRYLRRGKKLPFQNFHFNCSRRIPGHEKNATRKTEISISDGLDSICIYFFPLLFVAERKPRGNGDRQLHRGDLLEGRNENEEEEDRGRRW